MTSGLLLILFGVTCLAIGGLLRHLDRTSARNLYYGYRALFVIGVAFVLIGAVTAAINISLGDDW